MVPTLYPSLLTIKKKQWTDAAKPMLPLCCNGSWLMATAELPPPQSEFCCADDSSNVVKSIQMLISAVLNFFFYINCIKWCLRSTWSSALMHGNLTNLHSKKKIWKYIHCIFNIYGLLCSPYFTNIPSTLYNTGLKDFWKPKIFL